MSQDENKISDQIDSGLSERNKLYSDIDHLTTEVTRLREAIQYYFDVLDEVRGESWKDKPDHVLKKMIDAMNPKP
jgi:hypothetical protein